MKRYIVISFLLIIISASCGNGRKTLSPQQYLSWAKKSQKDLQKIKEINGYRFTAKFQPAELLVLRNKEALKSQDALDSTKKIQDGIINIVMDIGSVNNQQSLLRANLSNEEEYYSRMYYYTTEVQNDVYLVEGNDTLPCIFYHFEQTFNITPVNSMIMEFKRINSQSAYQDICLVYEDRILNTGIVKFMYKNSFLNNLPQLKLL